MKTLTREVTTLQKLRHRNIIQLYEALETPSHLYIFLQYVAGGTGLLVCTRAEEGEPWE